MDITVNTEAEFIGGEMKKHKGLFLGIVNFLLEMGAEREALTEDGETALDLVDTEG